MISPSLPKRYLGQALFRLLKSCQTLQKFGIAP